MKIEIKKLGIHELRRFKDLIDVFEDVFEMKDFQIPDDRHLEGVLKRDGFFVFVALSDNEVIGGLTCYTLVQYYSKSPLVYIYDLAIKTEFQRQGIGRMLISDLVIYCREIGIEEIFVQADDVDLHALEFYHSTGAIAEKVTHFYYPLNT